MTLSRTVWTTWAQTAPALRLRPLRFALSDDLAAIHGDPLPPLPGLRHVEQNGIVYPCGYEFSPPVPARTLAQAFGLSPGDLALLAPDGSCDILPAEVFVHASRSAVRLSSPLPLADAKESME